VALLVATALPDFADFVLHVRICRVPCEQYTHAFPAVLLLAVAMAALAWVLWHSRVTALLTGAMVLMHPVADLVTGRKPFWLGGPPVGLFLYRFPEADFAMESVLIILAWALLRRSQGAPRWAVHPMTLCALVMAQAAYDFLQ
jgi:membrane-bound metal-dependent hydrolase YbcI (DUF457 family)